MPDERVLDRSGRDRCVGGCLGNRMIPLRSQRLCLQPHDRPWPATRRACLPSGSLLPFAGGDARVEFCTLAGVWQAVVVVV